MAEGPMPQFANLPRSLNGPHSPMLATDSPFPPIKTEHRYRGVYERAGFDVNLGGYRGNPPSNNDTRTIALRRKPSLPVSQTFSFKTAKSFPNQHEIHSQSLRSLPMKGRGNISPTESRSSSGKASSKSSHSGQKQYPDLFAPGSVSAPASAHPANAPQKFQMPRRAPTYQKHPEIQPFQPFNPNEEKVALNTLHSVDEVPPRSDKNVKNLQLHIPDSNHIDSTEFSRPEADFSSHVPAGSGSDSETNSPMFEPAESSSTAHTSASSSQDFKRNSVTSAVSVKTAELVKTTPYPVEEQKDLTSMLELFRLDVEEHKKYDPRRKASRSTTRSPNSTNTFTPDTSNHSLRLNDSYSSVSSFNNTKEPVEYQKTAGPLEFSEFLETSAAGDRVKARNSNLSTISSIISKLNDEGEYAADDDVDPELSRQLESLKAGAQEATETPVLKPIDDDSFVTAHDLPDAAQRFVPVPVFNIQDVSDTPRQSQTFENFETSTDISTVSSPTKQAFERDLRESDDFERPQTEHDDESVKNYDEFRAPTTPYNQMSEFESQETPETIKPLSPKNHRIEEELENMNFKYNQEDEFDESPTIPPRAMYEGLDGINNRPPTTEFNPFPQSVIGTDYPKFRDSDLPMKTPPGHGKCRGCGEEVDKLGKGSKKAIFSKTGELSGQWHRGCFSCSYTGCDVKFNKHTACYVLLDNAFCNHHYHSLNGTLCQTCDNGIEGECIENEMRQKWHVHCLKCNRCDAQIQEDYFLVNGEIVCENDANQLMVKMRNEGMLTTDKIEKRRTRMMFVDQVPEF